jgi:polysaccharide biosynthesis protein PslH
VGREKRGIGGDIIRVGIIDRKMRILLVTPMPPQQKAAGAIPVVLHAQMAGLTPRHEVTLVTVAGLEPGEQEAVERLCEEGIEVHAVRRTKINGLPRWQRRWRMASTWIKGLFPWRTVWFWEPELQRIIDGLLVEDRFDLVSVEDNSMGIYRYNTTRPKFITEHELRQRRPLNWGGLSTSNPFQWVFDEQDWTRWQRYQKLVWKKFDRIQVFTRRDAEAVGLIEPDLAGRVRVNPFGIQIPPPPDPQKEVEGQLLFIGNYTHPPNVDAALWLGREILPRLRERCSNVHLNLVGIYPPDSVKELACEDICVTGPVPEVEPYLERAAVVMAPVRTGGGMRMKVLQAMASGKAVVTTPVGADGMEIFDGQSSLAVCENTEQIVNTTAELLANPARRRALGERAREFVMENYSVQAYARRLEEVFFELVEVEKGEVI